MVATHLNAMFASLSDVAFEVRVGVSGAFGGFYVHEFYIFIVSDGFPIDTALIFRNVDAVVVGARLLFYLDRVGNESVASGLPAQATADANIYIIANSFTFIVRLLRFCVADCVEKSVYPYKVNKFGAIPCHDSTF